ncbi:phosphodiesterase [Desulfovibrio litoralis]|uniref:Phosphoesterase n=1 Tax=Desulfovibrio litoralis DSM 11393 TaxID=1121455 RepID=A0A1M7TFQ7_9BACT|nr:phosphodiesterase [Desulfovibrio litoralis]SHN69535.1 hypothetical protein SAMN02745728_01961 [Desulfovibrio litoralis DSM 11393]
MIFLVVSDLHGAVEAADIIPDLLQMHKADTLILLGDLLYHGPRNPMHPSYEPAKTAELLNKLSCRIIAVKGNCDAKVDLSLLDFPVANDFSWLYLENKAVFLTHGDVYLPNPPIKQGDICLYGHTHIPEASYRGGAYFFNPGSIAKPKHGYAQSYGVLKPNLFSVFNLDGESFLHSEF